MRRTTRVATTVVGVASVKNTINYEPGAGMDVTGPAPPVAPGPVPPGQTPVVVTIDAGTGYGVVSFFFGIKWEWRGSTGVVGRRGVD